MKRVIVIVFAIVSVATQAQQSIYDVSAGNGNGIRFGEAILIKYIWVQAQNIFMDRLLITA